MGKEKRKLGKWMALGIVISSLSMVALFFHLSSSNEIKFDVPALVLLFVALTPWMSLFLDSLGYYKGIVRLELLFLGAWDFYLDDISLDGTPISPPGFWRPEMRKIPEEIYDYDLRFSHPPVLERLEGME